MEPFCVTHPDKRAVQTCERCGRFACMQCLEVKALPKALCHTCFEAIPRPASDERSRRATVALVFGVLGLPALFPLGIVAIVLGSLELLGYSRGRVSEKSRFAAQLAVGFGGFSILAFVALLLALVKGLRWYFSQMH